MGRLYGFLGAADELRRAVVGASVRTNEVRWSSGSSCCERASMVPPSLERCTAPRRATLPHPRSLANSSSRSRCNCAGGTSRSSRRGPGPRRGAPARVPGPRSSSKLSRRREAGLPVPREPVAPPRADGARLGRPSLERGPRASPSRAGRPVPERRGSPSRLGRPSDERAGRAGRPVPPREELPAAAPGRRAPDEPEGRRGRSEALGIGVNSSRWA